LLSGPVSYLKYAAIIIYRHDRADKKNSF